MGEQRAGRIKLLARDDDVVALVLEFGLELGRTLGAELGKRIAKARSFEDFSEQKLLLGFVGDRADGGGDADVVLRDLADGGIAGRDDLGDARNRRVGEFRPAETLGNVQRPQSALRIEIKFANRPLARRVADA
jgi:hypothetical protein